MADPIRQANQDIAERTLHQLKYDWDRLNAGKRLKQYDAKGKTDGVSCEDESMILIKLFMESDLFDSLCYIAGYDTGRWIQKNDIHTEDAYKFDLSKNQAKLCLGVSGKTFERLVKLEILKPKRTVIKKVTYEDKKTGKVEYRDKPVPLFDPREVENLAMKAIKKTGAW